MLLFNKPAVAGWSLVNHIGQAGTAAASTATAAINTSGANLIVVSWMTYGNSALVTITDSQTNTWTYIDRSRDTAGNVIGWAYVYGPSTSTAHTFTADASGIAGGAVAVIVQAWSGSVATPLDQHTIASGSSTTTILSTAITPSQANCLILNFVGFSTSSGTTGTPTVNQSFVKGDAINHVPAVTYGAAIGSLQQGAAASVNPTWTAFGTDTYASTGSVLASFK